MKENEKEVKEQKEMTSKVDQVASVTEEVRVGDEKKFVVRKTFKGKDKRIYSSYELPVVFCEKCMSIKFVPKDRGGYEILDVIFSLSDRAELIEMQESIDMGGSKNYYRKFVLRVVKETGEILDFPVKFKADSDKALYDMIFVS